MTGSDEPAAAGSGRLRVGHADRDQVIRVLKEAFVHGRLTGDEFGERASSALAARTRGELAALTADIPGGRAGPPVAARASLLQRHPLVWAAAGLGSGVTIAVGLVMLAANILDPHGLGDPYHPWSKMCLLLALAALFSGIGLAVHGVGTAVEQRRIRRQRLSRP